MNRQITRIKFLVLAIITLCGFAAAGKAQTTAFTYQGRFTDSTVAQPTNGTYNMQFAMFDAAANGNQIGVPVVIPAVQVVNGIFTVSLDYTAANFDGTARFLQVTIGNTVLSPRQEITSAPFAIMARKALLANDSNKLGGIDADQYVTGQVVRSVNNLTNNVTLAAGNNITITPSGNTLTIAATGGGGSGISNQTSLQANANFNVDGTGAANIFNATTQFNIGGNRVLSVKGIDNFFGGSNSGANNNPATASGNTFVGSFSGNANTAGIYNSFFGTDAGRNNQADANAFFGRSSGFANTSGASNSFFGLDSGRFNVAGSNNSFYGRNAGFSNLTDNNSFFGYQAGVGTTTGGGNSFFGLNAGSNNTIGSFNTMLGNGANVTANNLNFATAIGAGASVSTSNTIVLGTASTGTEIPGTLKVFTLGATGGTTLCRNASNQIADCPAGTGGGNYIENSTAPQPNAFFNISGGGTLGGTLSANLINSITNYRIGGSIVLATPNATSVIVGPLSNYSLTAGNNAFFGYKAGAAANNTGQGNVFFGSEAGTTNSSGAGNSFVGRDAGFSNSSGGANSFFGNSAGKQNTTASFNSFFGTGSGISNTTGERNSFFGFQSGQLSKIVDDNSFFGYQAGKATTGADNAFFGSKAGLANTIGSGNAFFGSSAGSNNTTGSNNTFIGENSGGSVGNGNTVVGNNTDASGDNNTIIGNGSYSAAGGSSNTTIGFQAKVIPFDASSSTPTNSTAIGAGAVVNLSNTIVLGTDQEFVQVPGKLSVSGNSFTSSLTTSTLTVTGGSIKFTVVASPTNTNNRPLCLNNNSLVALCSFSRPSDEQNPQVEMQTSQIQAQSEQLKLQAAQIEEQQKQLRQQQILIENLRKVVCATNGTAEVCQK